MMHFSYYFDDFHTMEVYQQLFTTIKEQGIHVCICAIAYVKDTISKYIKIFIHIL